MSNFRPIAMRCTQEQFDSIKDILIRSGVRKVEYDDYYEYIFIDEDFEFDQINEISVEFMDAEVHEEWNEEIFLEACGIICQQKLQDRLANLEKEIKEVRALIEEENKPKIGDICKFWDDDKSRFIVGKLEVVETGSYPYYVHGTIFKNCEKITNENLLKTFNNL